MLLGETCILVHYSVTTQYNGYVGQINPPPPYAQQVKERSLQVDKTGKLHSFTLFNLLKTVIDLSKIWKVISIFNLSKTTNSIKFSGQHWNKITYGTCIPVSNVCFFSQLPSFHGVH